MDFAKIDFTSHSELAQKIVREAVKKTFKDRHHFQKFRNIIIKEHKGVIFHNLHFIRAYHDLLEKNEIEPNEAFLKLIQKRSVRTLSGVTPVTVMTKPYPCPGRCIYCPTDVRMPKSYLPSQPAAQRGFRQRFHPYTQIFVRLKALVMTGHEISKVELRVLGGTWSSYPKKYQTWFVKSCLQAMNEFYDQLNAYDEKFRKSRIKSPYGIDEVNTLVIKNLRPRSTLQKAIKTNETARVKCIGINVETRPDHVDVNEIRRLRMLGVTKVEIGVQTTDDRVQKITKRGHDLAEVKKATALLKDAGFKLSYHMMPNLPGSSIELDKKMVGELFTDASYQPDYLKIYPCMVIPCTPLAMWYRKGEYTSYNDDVLLDVLQTELASVPEWCRVDRLARDIPSDEIESGSKTSNVRQMVEKRLIDAGTPPREIRFREIGDRDYNLNDVAFIRRVYDASDGKEYFLSYEDTKQNKLIALLRLRFPNKNFIQELCGAAIVREVHVYGKQVAVGNRGFTKQHIGWGTKLLERAEKIAIDVGYKKVAVIAGIGTREYYAKKGYILDNTYMIKWLD